MGKRRKSDEEIELSISQSGSQKRTHPGSLSSDLTTPASVKRRRISSPSETRPDVEVTPDAEVKPDALTWTLQKDLPPARGVSIDNAVPVLQRYVGSLRNDLSQHNVKYNVIETSNGRTRLFSASLTLPFNSPVKYTEDRQVYPSKAKAKGGAALIALHQLVSYGEITADLVPTPAHPSNARGSRSSGVAGINPAGAVEVPYIPEAAWWSAGPQLTKRAYATKISLSFGPPHRAAGQECRSLLLVTSRPLPFPGGEFDVSGQNVVATAQVTESMKLRLHHKDLPAAYKFSTALFDVVTGRTLSGSLDQAGYLILPLKPNTVTIDNDAIAWDEVYDAEKDLQPFMGDINSLLGRCLAKGIQGPRWLVTELRPDMTPNSRRNGEQIGRIKHETWKQLGYTGTVTDWDAPLVVGESDVAARSGGIVAALGGQAKTAVLIPELLTLHPLRAATLRTSSILPAVFAAIDTQLLAIEMSQALFSDHIPPSLGGRAITAPSSRPFKGCDDYERLELLGDTVLKFAAAASIYHETSHTNAKRGSEGSMSVRRHLLVANSSLLEAATAAGVVPYIRATFRAPRDFMPRGWTVLSGAQLKPLPTTQMLGDKVVADVAEALIAASLLSTGETFERILSTSAGMELAFDTIRRLHIALPVQSWTNIKGQALTGAVRDGLSPKPLTLLGYTFKDPAKGRITLSRAHARPVFERYEFLGDALLDYFTLLRLWEEYPDASPAELTHAKHSRATFAAFMVVSGLADEVTDDPNPARAAKAIAALQAKKRDVDRSITEGGSPYEWWSTIRPEKAFGDMLEAIFGAILDDSHFDPWPAKRAYDAHILPFVRQYANPPTAHSMHPRSVFQTLISKAGCHHMRVEYDRTTGSVVAKVLLHGKVIGQGSGEQQTVAEREAFKLAAEHVATEGVNCQEHS